MGKILLNAPINNFVSMHVFWDVYSKSEVLFFFRLTPEINAEF